MKKLVTAACALAAGIALADGVTSTNIVGYQQTTCIAGLNFIAPNFNDVGNNTVVMKSITLSGEVTSGDYLQVLDEDGNQVSSYTWSLDGDYGATDGWYDDEMDYAGNSSIARGLSLLLSCEEDDVIVTVAGEVNTTPVALTCVAGLNSVGNFFPKAIPVGNIVLSGETVTSGDYLQVLDADGNQEASFTWSLDGDYGATDGWYDDEMDYAASTEIPAGLGLLLSCEEDDVVITINYDL